MVLLGGDGGTFTLEETEGGAPHCSCAAGPGPPPLTPESLLGFAVCRSHLSPSVSGAQVLDSIILM